MIFLDPPFVIRWVMIPGRHVEIQYAITPAWPSVIHPLPLLRSVLLHIKHRISCVFVCGGKVDGSFCETLQSLASFQLLRQLVLQEEVREVPWVVGIARRLRKYLDVFR